MDDSEQQKTPGNMAALGKITKKWDESTVEEKLEKLRQEIMNQRGVSRWVGQIAEKVMDLERHEHNESGKILVPMIKQPGGGSTTMGNRIDPLA